MVTDPTGAGIANATVTITDTATRDVRTLTTKGDGSYLAQELRTGDVYKIDFAATGFRGETVEGIRLLTDTPRRVDGTLKAGTEATVTVTAAATQLLTENAALQDTVTQRQMLELPLVVESNDAGRTPISFLYLDSGVTTANGNGTTTGNFRVYGNQAGSTDIQIDGATTRRAQNANFFSETTPGPDAYQEFTATTSQYSAESGASTGGVVNFAIKSGTNDFHGEAYDYLQNERLNANGFLNDLTKQPKPRDHQNNFGGNIGGPIRFPYLYNGKDHAFFFFNYEGYREANGQNVLVTVPTAKMRTGDFSELLTDPYVTSFIGHPVQIYDPHIQGLSRPAIPGNRLDLYNSPATGQPVIDPAGLKLINEFPLPTTSGVFHNYAARSIVPVNSDAYVAKGDYIVSAKQHFDISYTYRNKAGIQGGFPRLPFPATANGVWNQVFKSHYARFQHDYTFSPAVINHFNLGWNRAFVTNMNTTLNSAFTAPKVGIPADATQGVAGPRIGFPGYGDVVTSADPRATQEIGSTFFSDAQGDNTVDAADIVGWNIGRHNVRFGADVRIQQLNVQQFIDPGGSFNFRADQTGTDAAGGNGWPLASLITGATEFSFVTIHNAQPAYRFKYPAFFANDDFKVTKNLVLNIGMRYEIPYARTESHNFLRGFSPTVINPATGTPGALISANPANGPAAPEKGLASTYFGNFGPRLGFAWTVHPTTVLRGGWGIYYGPLQYNNDITAGTLGYSNSRLITPGQDYAQSTAFLSTYPAKPLTDPTSQFAGPGSGCFSPSNGCTDVQYFGTQYRTGLVQQFSMNVQQEFANNFVATIGYTGHLGQRLTSNFGRLNALPFNDLVLGGPLLNKPLSAVNAADIAYAQSVGVPIPGAPFAGFIGSVAQALRPFPQYGFITNENETNGRDYYHSLQAKLEHRFSSGLQMGASYTWSKLITNAAEDIQGTSSVLSGSLQYPDASNLRAIRTVSPSDVPHSFVINYIYELPFGKDKHYLSHGGLVDSLVGGWQVAGVQRYQSDTPLVVVNGDPGLTNNFLNTIGVGGVLRPNLTGMPIKLSGQKRDANTNLLAVLNPAAFTPTPTFNPGLNPGDPGYAAYFANPSTFFGTAPVVLANVRPFPLLSEDLSVLKKTRFGERFTVETRAEFFNAFNRHSYLNPDTAINDGGNFGQSSVVGGGRIIQLGARILF